MGTDTESYHNNAHYLGIRRNRIEDGEYYEFLEEFLMAVKDKCTVMTFYAHISLILTQGRPRCFSLRTSPTTTALNSSTVIGIASAASTTTFRARAL